MSFREEPLSSTARPAGAVETLVEGGGVYNKPANKLPRGSFVYVTYVPSPRHGGSAPCNSNTYWSELETSLKEQHNFFITYLQGTFKGALFCSIALIYYETQTKVF